MGNICEQTCNCCSQGQHDLKYDKYQKVQQIKVVPQTIKQHINVSRAKQLKPVQSKKIQVVQVVTQQQGGDGPHPSTAKLSTMPKLTRQQIQVLNRQLPLKQQFNKIKGKPLSCFFLNSKRIWYQGQWKQGLPNGKGKAYLESGMYYQGYFQQGYAKSNDAIAVFPDGSYYRGQVSNSRLVGKGMYYNADKQIGYQGDWVDDKPDGFGTQQFANGNKYQGNFKDGYKNGKGIFRWKNGMVYEGDFKLGYMWGHGTLKKDKGFYQGQFQRGKKIAKSTKFNTQTGMYQGGLQNGLMNGNGTFIWNDQKKYVGGFQNGELNGKGTLSYPNGQSVSGVWDKGLNEGIDRISSK